MFVLGERVGNIVICLEFTLFVFFRVKKERKGKVLLRTLKLTEEFANSTYQGSAEDIFYIYKKTSFVYFHKREGKKGFSKRVIFSVSDH